MYIRCIAPVGSELITLRTRSDVVTLPPGWVQNPQTKVIEPTGLPPIGKPRAGWHPHFAPRRLYADHGSVIVDTREQAENIRNEWLHHGEILYGIAPVGSKWLVLYTGLELHPGDNDRMAGEWAALISWLF